MRFPRQSEASAGGREWRRWVGAHTAGTNRLSARAYCTHSRVFCWHAIPLQHTHTHICWSAHAHAHAFTQKTANITQTFAPVPCKFGLIYRLHVGNNEGNKSVHVNMYLIVCQFDEATIVQWVTQCLSNMYVWRWETSSYVRRPVLLIFLWMNLSPGKCGYDSFLNLLRGEVFMVPVRILGNLALCHHFFVSDWILPFSSDEYGETGFMKPQQNKQRASYFCVTLRMSTASLFHLTWGGLELFYSPTERNKPVEITLEGAVY